MLNMLTRQLHLNKPEKKVNYLKTWKAGAVRQVSASKGKAFKTEKKSPQSQGQESL